MKSRVLNSLALLALLVGGVSAAQPELLRFQTSSENLESTIVEMENRITGLEARVTSLEALIDDRGTATETADQSDPIIHVLTGTLSIFYSLGISSPEGEPCTGKDSTATSTDFSGIRAGSRITVYDSNEKVLATGELQPGVTVHGSGETDGGMAFDYTNCLFRFEVGSIPDSDFYVIELSGLEGTLTLSKEELDELDWTLILD